MISFPGAAHSTSIPTTSVVTERCKTCPGNGVVGYVHSYPPVPTLYNGGNVFYNPGPYRPCPDCDGKGNILRTGASCRSELEFNPDVIDGMRRASHDLNTYLNLLSSSDLGIVQAYHREKRESQEAAQTLAREAAYRAQIAERERLRVEEELKMKQQREEQERLQKIRNDSKQRDEELRKAKLAQIQAFVHDQNPLFDELLGTPEKFDFSKRWEIHYVRVTPREPPHPFELSHCIIPSSLGGHPFQVTWSKFEAGVKDGSAQNSSEQMVRAQIGVPSLHKVASLEEARKDPESFKRRLLTEDQRAMIFYSINLKSFFSAISDEMWPPIEQSKPKEQPRPCEKQKDSDACIIL